MLPLVAAVKSPLERNKFIDIVARAVSQSPDAVREAMPKADASGPREPYGGPSQGRAPRNPEAPHASSSVSALEQRRGLLFAVIKAYSETGLAERLKKRYCDITNAPAFPIEALADLDERLLFEAEREFGEAPSDEAGDELATVFELMYLRDARTAVGQDYGGRKRQATLRPCTTPSCA